MPYKEKEITKLYYTMGDVSSMLDVNHSLIRFWEQEFDILKPKKNKKGNRLFTPKDVENLKLIYHLVKERGYTLEGARKKLKSNPDELDHNMEIVDKLKGIKSYLMELKEYL
ncbi:MAG: DNA-binding transcriptional MerR regulator [Parvicellaceae bacterium]|jgi:DNA-binding transcriptional MerR regulator